MDAGVLKTFVLGFLAICLLTLLGIYYVWQQQRVVQMGAELAQASKTLERVRIENELLEAEYRTLRSAERFGERAFARRGMKRPTTRDTIVVTPQGSSELERRGSP